MSTDFLQSLALICYGAAILLHLKWHKDRGDVK